jgi:hypothetical protein
MHLRVPRGNAGERPIAAVRLHYDDLAESKPGECEGSLGARLSTVTAELTPLDAIVSARLTATEAAGTLEASNALFRAGHADQARALIVQEQQKLVETRTRAVHLASPERRPDVEKSFDKTAGVLDSDDDGFAQPTVAAGQTASPPPAPAGDHKGQAQVRKNQQDAIELSE